jgi:hypothetical protein
VLIDEIAKVRVRKTLENSEFLGRLGRQGGREEGQGQIKVQAKSNQNLIKA